MHAKKYSCKLLFSTWLSPTVLKVVFAPSKSFKFEPGQFISVIIPPGKNNSKPCKRLYSLACSFEHAVSKGYELCVEVLPNGIGSQYLAQLQPGDFFQIFAPYGDFRYEPPTLERSVCFISTGTGVAPLRAMMQSKSFRENFPKRAVHIVGARTEKDILYSAESEKLGVKTIVTLTQPSSEWMGPTGRVTDYLKDFPTGMNWRTTDFYISGNGRMIEDVTQILCNVYGVLRSAIKQESFFSALAPVRVLIAEKAPARSFFAFLAGFKKAA